MSLSFYMDALFYCARSVEFPSASFGYQFALRFGFLIPKASRDLILCSCGL